MCVSHVRYNMVSHCVMHICCHRLTILVLYSIRMNQISVLQRYDPLNYAKSFTWSIYGRIPYSGGSLCLDTLVYYVFNFINKVYDIKLLNFDRLMQIYAKLKVSYFYSLYYDSHRIIEWIVPCGTLDLDIYIWYI